MIRKIVIVLCILGFVGCSFTWALSRVPRRSYFAEYGGGGRIVGVWSWPERYVIDVRVFEKTRVGFGIDNGALVTVLMRPTDRVRTVVARAIRVGRLRLWREVLEDPMICGEPFNHSGLGGPSTTAKLVLGMHVPCWVAWVLFAAYPTLAFVRGPVRRWRRRRRGLCVRCGYNLTGNVSGVCPECGTEIEKP